MPFLPILPKLGERGWQRQVLELAGMFSWGAWHDRATNLPPRCPNCKADLKMLRNDPGWPDLFLIRDDTLIVAELKSDRGTTTPDQRAWLDAFRRVRRVIVAVWKPKDLDEVVRTLR
jgi:hypothetical protein